MFIIINNKSFKCTEFRVSNIIRLHEENYLIFGNILGGTGKRTEENTKLFDALDEMVKQKFITFKKLEKDDKRIDSSKFGFDPDNHKIFRIIYELSPTEHIYQNSNSTYLITHPEGIKYMFYIYDDHQTAISKAYDTREECQEAWERIMAHTNQIVYELPKEYV